MNTPVQSLDQAASPGVRTAATTRWMQLALGLVCMMTISSPQYVWTLMTKPLMAKMGISLPEVQVTFSILVFLQAFFSPFQGALIDRFGPRKLISIGTLLAGVSWMLASYASSTTMLYLTYGGLGGLGTGIVYVGVVGLMVRWFPDRRGMAAGAVAAGYGMGAIVTTFPVSASLAAHGVDSTLWLYGMIFAVIGFIASQGLRVPPAAAANAAATANTPSPLAREFRPSEMLKTPIFWLMFAMMTMMSTGGLMVTSNFANFAKEFGVADLAVLGMAAVPLALTVDRILNGLTRPFWGWVSDHIGRYNTMGIAFGLEGLSKLALLYYMDDPVLFVFLTALSFFAWGEIFSLFPAAIGDVFGPKYATTNYGIQYTSKGLAAIFAGWGAAALMQVTGSWGPVFWVSLVCDLLAATLAFFLLKPLVAARMRKMAEVPAPAVGAVAQARAT
jgi:MFS transporter, OFA family, oxalate/formate antiporter